MGDEAEGVFEETSKRGFVRSGLDRPPISMSMLPPMVRYTPDYLTSAGYVEVQGVGRDQVIKLKHDKLQALLAWADIFACDLFVWDRPNTRITQFDITEFPVELCDIGEFKEGKTYLALHADDVPSEWTEVNLGAF